MTTPSMLPEAQRVWWDALEAGARARVAEALAGGRAASIAAALAALGELLYERWRVEQAALEQWRADVDEYVDALRADGLIEGVDFGVTS